jgi:hypothetical protein
MACLSPHSWSNYALKIMAFLFYFVCLQKNKIAFLSWLFFESVIFFDKFLVQFGEHFMIRLFTPFYCSIILWADLSGWWFWMGNFGGVFKFSVFGKKFVWDFVTYGTHKKSSRFSHAWICELKILLAILTHCSKAL